MPATLFNATPLSVNFQPSQPAMIGGGFASLRFNVEVLAGSPLAIVLFYLEYSQGTIGQPAASWPWYRELTEEMSAGGAVNMNQAERRLGVNGGAALPVGIYRASYSFESREQFFRLQARASTGNVRLTVQAPLSTLAQT